MAKSKKDMRDTSREGREREETTRSSRRAEGLPPEEHASLEEVVRAARKAGAAKRKAAREEKKRSLSQDQPAAKLPVQDDAHQVSADGEAGSELGTGQGEPGPGEPEVASVGGADVDESRVEGRVSDSPLPGQDVNVRAPAQDVLLPTVLENVSGGDAEALVLLEEKSPPDLLTEMQAIATPSSQQLSEDAAKAYVAKQVSRWEQVRSERVLPPSVQYVWPDSRPDSLPWLTATLATSKYIAARATLGDDIQACVVELNLDRRDLATAQDVVAAEIPVGIFSPRECVAVLQTLLFEAGFHFDNLVPVWFRTRASKIAADLVRSLVGDLQRLLAAELTEWRTLCVGATLKVTPALEREAEVEDTPFLDYHAEDQDGDLLMNDYEVNLLGRSYVLRLRMTGLRPARSTTSSSVGEPPSKRQQHRPPRPEDPLASLPSELPSTATSDQEDPSTVPTSDPVPSLVGTTDRSARGTTSESLVSRNSSPGSSSTSLESGGEAHMPLATYGPMVMSTRTSGSGMPGGGDLGYYLTSQVITPERSILPDQEDVIMADPEVAVSTKPGEARESRRRRSDRVSNRRHSSSESESESDRSRHRRSSRSRRSSSKKHSRKRSSSRRSSYSGRSHRSGRSGWSVSTGVVEAAVSALREAQQVREELAKLTEQLAAQKLTSTPEVDVQHALAEAEVCAGEAELRAQEAERRLAGVSIEDTGGVAQREDVAAAIQAACLQAANAERERVEATAVQLLQQQQCISRKGVLYGRNCHERSAYKNGQQSC
ncbi:hypothetical protein PF005_g21282 [Phytophthora fragariae]|uniref:Uncharacterized protein n=1 Tax=Phytophthora fragariae TaxID=53985 RepID=A0A6A3WI57_9STRA|nr:hypothetical protein PF003_g12398 [Phytophthora fragariae]KAE8927538.1 hypothetical protein PF009_g22301 [Phytophthora fragariae]KAE9110956.1 hypothetical protein PF006_g20327 [Phytophthora fragariae]KAE9111172.1 hypothetical protein PF007_g11577 [Phytophthora fragariae]KAE9185379.1 hypothetical protein PF005_g21282 [Phytophthora fragariae]